MRAGVQILFNCAAGLYRNLRVSEIIGQVWRAAKIVGAAKSPAASDRQRGHDGDGRAILNDQCRTGDGNYAR